MIDTVHRAGRRMVWRLAAVAIGGLLAACSTPTDSLGGSVGAASSGAGAAPSGTVRLYTSVTQDTVDAVLAAYARVAPDVQVDVFRAPTGELDARIAAELRQGQLAADVLWGTDPLSVQSYAARHLLETWKPAEAASVPDAYHTDTFWGTRLLNMVIVHHTGMADPPADWTDLAAPALAGEVAIPDPGFAGSAFAALGYFASNDAYGMNYYRRLADNGAVQVQAIAEVLTGVAEGRFSAGMVLDKTARDAIAQGSPIEMTWPSSGAITLYSPVAVFAQAPNRGNGEHLANFLLGTAAQAAIASTGWQPIRADVPGPAAGGGQVSPDWPEVFAHQDELLAEYRAIFGG